MAKTVCIWVCTCVHEWYEQGKEITQKTIVTAGDVVQCYRVYPVYMKPKIQSLALHKTNKKTNTIQQQNVSMNYLGKRAGLTWYATLERGKSTLFRKKKLLSIKEKNHICASRRLKYICGYVWEYFKLQAIK